MNEEQLQEFRDQHGLTEKKRQEAKSDLQSVRTPDPETKDPVDLVRPDGTIR